MAKGSTNTHILLKTAAEVISNANAPTEVLVPYQKVASFILIFSSLEGHLNWLGSIIAPEIWKDERKHFSRGKYVGTLGKLDFLAERCNYIIHKDKMPYLNVKKLKDIRDALMHPKPEAFEPGDNNHLLAKIEELSINDIKSDVFKVCEELQEYAAKSFPVIAKPFGNVISAEPIPGTTQMKITVAPGS